MIRDIERWQAFENQWIADEKPDYAANLRLVEGMVALTRSLGKFICEDALDGLDNTIHLNSLA